MRGDGPGLARYLTTLDVFTLDATQEHTDVVARLTLVKQLAEHFYAGTGGLGGWANPDDFDFFADFDDSTLDTTGDNGATAGDGEDVFDRASGRACLRRAQGWDIAIEGIGKLHDGELTELSLVTFKGFEGGAFDDRDVVTGEVVLAEQFANFHFNEFEQFGVINHVTLVQEDDDVRYAYLAGQQDVLTGLRHGTVSSGTDKNGTVHLGGTGYHVLDIVGVTRTVHVRIVSLGRLVFNVGRIDGDARSFSSGALSIWS